MVVCPRPWCQRRVPFLVPSPLAGNRHALPEVCPACAAWLAHQVAGIRPS